MFSKLEITAFTFIAAIVVIYGIYRFMKGNRVEGGAEVFAGLLELIGEILSAML